MRRNRVSTVLAVVAATTAVAGATQAGAATPKNGPYTGQTGQGTGIKLQVESSRSGKAWIRWVDVKADAECADGSTEQVEISRLVLGTRVRNGRFRIEMADLHLRGRFVARNRIEGRLTIEAQFSDCDASMGYHVVRR
jgi:hypothetical protein